MGVTHSYVSPTGAVGGTVVDGPDWNADHDLSDFLPVGDSIILSAGNYTGTTGSFATITGATLTFTTQARRVRIGCVVTAQVGTANDALGLDVTIDGTRQGGTNGLTGFRANITGHRQNLSFTILTEPVSAASHTFTLQAKRIAGSGTITIFADSADAVLTFWAEETLLTA